MWFVFNTVGTVGYGDIICESILGKIIALLICVSGPILISILMVEILRFFSFEESQQFSFDLFERLEAKEEMRAEAARILKLLLRKRKLLNTLRHFVENNKQVLPKRFSTPYFHSNTVFPLSYSKTILTPNPVKK